MGNLGQKRGIGQATLLAPQITFAGNQAIAQQNLQPIINPSLQALRVNF